MNNQCKEDNKSLSKLQKYDSSHRQLFLKLSCSFFVLSDFSPANYLLHSKITRQGNLYKHKLNITSSSVAAEPTERLDTMSKLLPLFHYLNRCAEIIQTELNLCFFALSLVGENMTFKESKQKIG